MYPKERKCLLNKKEDLGMFIKKEDLGMFIKKKKFNVGNKIHNVWLKKEGNYYIVKVDEEAYKKTVNELFAVQTFNAI